MNINVIPVFLYDFLGHNTVLVQVHLDCTCVVWPECLQHLKRVLLSRASECGECQQGGRSCPTFIPKQEN